MAITQGMSKFFKLQIFEKGHNLVDDVLKIALYTDAATIGPDTPAYTADGEVSGVNTGYTTTGQTLAARTVVTNGESACFTATDPEWTSASFTTAGALIYNSSRVDNAAVGAITFGQNYTISNGTFRIIFPAQEAGTAIVRID